jgi:hypothetical protein
MNHFGYNAKSIQVVNPKISPTLKEKFISCGNVVPPRMSAVELWGMGGPLVSAEPACLSQSIQNNLAGASMPPINVPASEPPQSAGECSRATSNAATTHERGIPHYETERVG